MISETRARSLAKTISWRIIATLNSFVILLLFPDSVAIIAAVLMNITGFIIYYLFERIWQRVRWGKIWKS